jgi:hypothetical protein
MRAAGGEVGDGFADHAIGEAGSGDLHEGVAFLGGVVWVEKKAHLHEDIAVVGGIDDFAVATEGDAEDDIPLQFVFRRAADADAGLDGLPGFSGDFFGGLDLGVEEQAGLKLQRRRRHGRKGADRMFEMWALMGFGMCRCFPKHRPSEARSRPR